MDVPCEVESQDCLEMLLMNESYSETIIQFVTEEEISVLNSFAGYYKTISIGENTYTCEKRKKIDIKGLSLFEKEGIKLDNVPVERIRMSVRSLQNADLSDLSVVSNGLVSVSGSGKRVATEWWEKKNGYEMIFVQLNDSCFVYYFVNGDWCMSVCNQFLGEGAELCGDIMYVRQEMHTNMFIARLQKVKVEVVAKHNFVESIPEGIEGIVIVIDKELYRLKEKNTVDLICDGISARTAEGDVCFPTSFKGICEFDSKDGTMVVKRGDKCVADSNYKVNLMRASHSLQDLRKMMMMFNSRKENYLPTQHIGYRDYPRNCSPVHYAEYRFWQRIDEDELRIIEMGDYTQNIYLKGFVKDKVFDYVRFVQMCNYSGFSYNLELVRKQLFKLGVYCLGGKYRCFRDFEHEKVSLGHAVYAYRDKNIVSVSRYTIYDIVPGCYASTLSSKVAYKKAMNVYDASISSHPPNYHEAFKGAPFLLTWIPDPIMCDYILLRFFEGWYNSGGGGMTLNAIGKTFEDMGCGILAIAALKSYVLQSKCVRLEDSHFFLDLKETDETSPYSEYLYPIWRFKRVIKKGSTFVVGCQTRKIIHRHLLPFDPYFDEKRYEYDLPGPSECASCAMIE